MSLAYNYPPLGTLDVLINPEISDFQKVQKKTTYYIKWSPLFCPSSKQLEIQRARPVNNSYFSRDCND